VVNFVQPIDKIFKMEAKEISIYEQQHRHPKSKNSIQVQSIKTCD